LALDEPKDSDHQLEKEGVMYVVDKQVLLRCGTITIDFVEEGDWRGFALVAANPLIGGC